MHAGYLILSIIPQDGLAGTALQGRQCRLDPEPSGQTIVKPTALGPVANTDTKLLIYGLFQMGRVLAQGGMYAELALENAAIKDVLSRKR